MEIDYRPPADATIIWLHGLGADGHDFEQLPVWLGRPHTRYLLPDAPQRPVTLHGGAVMRAWFDVYGLGPMSPMDWAGLEDATAQLAEIVRQARADHDQPVVLGGFSQGGALALYAGLSTALPVAAIVGLSTYLPRGRSDAWTRSDAPPLFLAHGTEDRVIPLATGLQAVDRLRQYGLPVDWSTWPMGHSVHPDELAALATWVDAILSKQPDRATRSTGDPAPA